MKGFKVKVYYSTYIEVEPSAEDADDALVLARAEVEHFLANHIPWSFEDHRMVQFMDNLRPWSEADEVVAE